MKRRTVPSTHIVAVLHNLRSAHNVGSIFRTADAAGITKLYLCGITPAPIDRFGETRPQLEKVSLGAEKSVPWERARSTGAVLAELKKEGYKIFAVEQAKNSILYHEACIIKHGSKIALVFGNEVRGLPPSILKRADKVLEIPVRGAMVRQAHHPRNTNRGKESLNVSVAFGIVAFAMVEASERRG
ncbi:MAG: TrmH family RNA methyltransferase [Candidatus Liptonbacteria bacterium]|nr:TrmH family RNA methyltransferase [Candidatus Liptonbacteria bacterium]